eukprot:SAG11_NODE_35733_length_265_cov_0.626506_1_plen_35_part_01
MLVRGVYVGGADELALLLAEREFAPMLAANRAAVA